MSFKVLRQVKPGTSIDLERIVKLIMAGIGGFLLVFGLLFLALGESLLPIWIFVTSLTLIVHTILFKVTLPEEVFITLKVMLNVLRLKFFETETINYYVDIPDTFIVVNYTSTKFINNMG